ncbi:MAG: ABC transporter ATP-binding protein [Deltaproteobacteria bacterium]|nr:MAG: ABC transporter ATP-binding protein [Deltaproteobacteria bacterium]
MHFDYGYMEDRQLGKPYNIGLLKRLLPYARVYWRPICTALVLTLAITLFDLAVPYLPKVAIDNYILSFWHPVSGERVPRAAADEFRQKYGHLVDPTGVSGLGFLSSAQLKHIDPGDLRRYREAGLVSMERFYRIPSDMVQGDRPLRAEQWIKARGPWVYVPAEQVQGIASEQVITLRGRDLRGVMFIALLLLILIGGSVLLNYWEFFLLEKAGQHIMQDIRMELFSRIQGQSVRFFDENPVGRLVTRVTNDVENLNEMFKSVIVTVFKDVFLLSGIIVVLLDLNWRLALVSFALLPFVFLLTWFFSNRAREVFREIRRHIAAINAFLQERISGIRIVQLFVQEKSQLERFKALNHGNYLASMRQIKIFAVFMPSMEILSAVGIGLLIFYGGGKVIGEQLSLGSLVAFIGYIQIFFKPIRDISEKYNIMQSAMASMERIFGLMDRREVIQEPQEPQRPRKREGHVEFKDVSFSYNQGPRVLDTVSFEIRPGQVVALVGVTGSGKTTIINLLERFYEFDEGSILLDGIDIRNWGIHELRSQVGLVMQDVFIFAGSIAENISLGDGEVTGETVDEVARQVQAHRFISRLAGGLDHEVREGGATLSAGERQLLALGRALAYNPALLVLDEATSSVDPETERVIQDTISRLSRRQTTLIVAHRPSTIQQADKILVMHHGRIVEQGTHRELMASGRVYLNLVRFAHNWNIGMME